MGILQKADRCMDEAAALFGENKLFLAEKKAQETAGLCRCKNVDRLLLRGYGCSCGAGLNRDNNAC